MLGSLILLSSVLNVVCFHNQCSVFLFWRCWKQSMIGCVWYLLLTFLIWLFLEQLERGLISKDTDFSDKFQPNSRHDGYYFQFDYSYKLSLYISHAYGIHHWRIFEVAIETWPEWDLNPRPLNSFKMLWTTELSGHEFNSHSEPNLYSYSSFISLCSVHISFR